jgi:uncharacterized protein YbbC (DUF1343 family)
MTVLTGLDRLVRDAELQRPFVGKRLGLLVNQASVTREIQHAVAALQSQGLVVERVFAPEHGLWGQAQDMESVETQRDPIIDMTVRSLYAETVESLTPSEEDLDGLDAVIIDLPDIGTRYYTFAATAMYMARAASAAGVDLCVLDRPNPLGGNTAEGNLIEPGFESFVGAISVPNRHALTLVELLRYAAIHGDESFEFDWIAVQGWNRDQWADETGLPWVAPSPNMPTLDTATVYPGMCLLEATNLSEGRGTTRPFEIFGAPFLNTSTLAQILGTLELPGVQLRPILFRPAFQKWAGETCEGFQIHVADRTVVRPYRLGLALIWAIARLHPGDFCWRDQPYEFVSDIPAIDLLCGTAAVREAIEAGAGYPELVAAAIEGSGPFLERIDEILVYG